MPRALFGIGLLIAAAFLAACSSKSVLNQHQLHTLLQCPCPTIAPQATYVLPADFQCCNQNGAWLGGMAVGSDGNIWVAELDANMIARVTPAGQVTEFPVPTANAGPYMIAPGPDGNLWFTEANFNTIGRITTGGAVTEFPLPPPLGTAPVGPQGITSGPDGNIWFVHGGANVVAVMSTSGSLITSYTIPTANPVLSAPCATSTCQYGQATFIMTGPDNNMWFVEESGNKIGRVTLSNTPVTVDEFPIPTAVAIPKNLILGPDGNLWFPEIQVGNVGRVTMSGAITEFPVVADPQIHRLRRITAAQGTLWIVEAMLAPPWSSEIGEFDTSGTEMNLWEVGGLPRAIIAGPDGTPWFADEMNETVVRL